MKLKASLLALFVAGLIVSVAIAGPPPGKGKPPGKGNGNGASTSTTTTSTGKKTLICHRTGSKKRPWVLISVSNRSLKAHLRKGDVLPVNGKCPGSTGTTTTTTTTVPTTTSTTSSTTTTTG